MDHVLGRRKLDECYDAMALVQIKEDLEIFLHYLSCIEGAEFPIQPGYSLVPQQGIDSKRVLRIILLVVQYETRILTQDYFTTVFYRL